MIGRRKADYLRRRRFKNLYGRERVNPGVGIPLGANSDEIVARIAGGKLQIGRE
jgi:hypothetical protein